jgi:hypothetical protein
MPARGGNWKALSPRTRARWVSEHGGESKDPARREAQAQAAYESGAQISRAEAGHEPARVRAGRAISAMFGDSAEFRSVRSPTRGETRRLGRYDALVRQLREGKIGGAAFERRVRSWRPVGGQRLASDPDAVLARLDERRAADLELFEYVAGRAA